MTTLSPGRSNRLVSTVIAVSNLVLVCLLATTLIRFTVKDGDRLTGLIFYSSPLPLLVVVGVVCFLIFAFLERYVQVALVGLVLMLTVPLWLAQDWALLTPAPAAVAPDAKPLKVLFWNVARRDDLTRTYREIQRIDADVVGLVEFTGDIDERRAQLKERLPEYDVSVLGNYMYLLVKGTSEASVATDLGGSSAARQVAVSVNDQKWQILLIDIDARLTRSREGALDQIGQLCHSMLDEALIVMGDFNTPIDSIHLKPIRLHAKELYEAVGHGYGPTWPLPLPVLKLDQMWFNEHVQAIGYRRYTSDLSDHAAIEGIFQRRPAAEHHGAHGVDGVAR